MYMQENKLNVEKSVMHEITVLKITNPSSFCKFQSHTHQLTCRDLCFSVTYTTRQYMHVLYELQT